MPSLIVSTQRLQTRFIFLLLGSFVLNSFLHALVIPAATTACHKPVIHCTSSLRSVLKSSFTTSRSEISVGTNQLPFNWCIQQQPNHLPLVTANNIVFTRTFATLSSSPTSETTNPHLNKSTYLSKMLSSIGKSAKYVVSLLVVYILLSSESPLPLYYIASAVITSLIGKIIKKIVKQPRPEKSPKKGDGMPSSHTGAITFFATAIFYKSHLFLSNPLHRVILNLLTLSYGVSAW